MKPDGWYRVWIQETDYKQTSKGDGWCLHIRFDHLAPAYPGQYEMVFLTLEHPKEKTREIARSQLKAIALAVEHPNPDQVDDSEELHGKPFMLRLYSRMAENPKYADVNGMEQAIGGYNSVTQHEDKGKSGSSAPAPVPTTASSPAPVEDVPF